MLAVGEYNSTGGLIEETVYLGDIPVATLQPNGSGGINVFYIHTDHLNTPRKISQPTTGTLAWRWDTDPFGTAAPNQNPGGLATFIYNLRFPGQYYQAETGLNQNLNRDFDPLTGRYVESDPIGLASGGMSTYAYALGNPVSNADPTGRFVGPPPATTLNPASAAVTLSYYAGYGIGTLIYNAYSTEIQDALEDLFPYPATSPSPDPNASPSVQNPPSSATSNGCPPNDDCKDRLSDYHIQQRGLDPHGIKRGILGRNAPISRYELCRCKDGRIVIRNKGCTGPIIETGETM